MVNALAKAMLKVLKEEQMAVWYTNATILGTEEQIVVTYVTFLDDELEIRFPAYVDTYCDRSLFVKPIVMPLTISPKEIISIIFKNLKDKWLTPEDEKSLGGKVEAVVCSINGIPVRISGDANDSNEIYEDWRRRI